MDRGASGGYSPWGPKGSDMTEATEHAHTEYGKTNSPLWPFPISSQGLACAKPQKKLRSLKAIRPWLHGILENLSMPEWLKALG